VDFLDDIPFEADPMSEDEGEEQRHRTEEQPFMDNDGWFVFFLTDEEDTEDEFW